jgi:sensor histidine kinase YesM
LWLLVLAGWTIIAIVFGVGGSLTLAVTSYQPPQWGRSLAAALTEWYAWAALTPLIVWVSRRFRLAKARWLARLVTLAVIGVPVAFAKLLLTRTLRDVFGIEEYVVITNFATHYSIYWAVVAAVHALDEYQAGRERELRASQLEASLAAARLQLLTMQLQPHFLFNTLNAISELIHESPAAAERMIAGLGQLLRESLDASLKDVVPLERELELLSRYVEIQRVRFGARLDVSIHAAAGTKHALVPTLLLQPLVENSIKHGIAATSHAGRIAVEVNRQADTLIIEVEDDGTGFDAGARDGVGLANTRARLQALYGSQHAFEVGAAPHGGTRVSMTIPWAS